MAGTVRLLPVCCWLCGGPPTQEVGCGVECHQRPCVPLCCTIGIICGLVGQWRMGLLEGAVVGVFWPLPSVLVHWVYKLHTSCHTPAADMIEWMSCPPIWLVLHLSTKSAMWISSCTTIILYSWISFTTFPDTRHSCCNECGKLATSKFILCRWKWVWLNQKNFSLYACAPLLSSQTAPPCLISLCCTHYQLHKGGVPFLCLKTAEVFMSHYIQTRCVRYWIMMHECASLLFCW